MKNQLMSHYEKQTEAFDKLQSMGDIGYYDDDMECITVKESQESLVESLIEELGYTYWGSNGKANDIIQIIWITEKNPVWAK